MAADNTYRKFREVWTCHFGDMRADRQTNRQTDTLIAILRTPKEGDVIRLTLLITSGCCTLADP